MMSRVGAVSAVAALLALPAHLGAQRPIEASQIDRSKPVPAKSDVLDAWRRRQASITSFRFAWTEQQTYPAGWIPNPRFAEIERLSIPSLRVDRTYTVMKSVSVSGTTMRYSIEIDRKEEPDGVRVTSPNGTTDGLGVARHYSYTSAFDGQKTTTRLSPKTGSPPDAVRESTGNVDAQTLDTRAIMMALRPLDPTLGSRLIDRAVTNNARSFHKGRSTFLLEERHDPSGWKMLLWIEPERAFLVSRLVVSFEQRMIVDIDIDYVEDAKWGWVPSGWRVTEMLADGSRRVVAIAKISSYEIS